MNTFDYYINKIKNSMVHHNAMDVGHDEPLSHHVAADQFESLGDYDMAEAHRQIPNWNSEFGVFTGFPSEIANNIIKSKKYNPDGKQKELHRLMSVLHHNHASKIENNIPKNSDRIYRMEQQKKINSHRDRSMIHEHLANINGDQ